LAYGIKKCARYAIGKLLNSRFYAAASKIGVKHPENLLRTNKQYIKTFKIVIRFPPERGIYSKQNKTNTSGDPWSSPAPSGSKEARP
jgi:hypothetical protein